MGTARVDDLNTSIFFLAPSCSCSRPSFITVNYSSQYEDFFSCLLVSCYQDPKVLKGFLPWALEEALHLWFSALLDLKIKFRTCSLWVRISGSYLISILHPCNQFPDLCNVPTGDTESYSCHWFRVYIIFWRMLPHPLGILSWSCVFKRSANWSIRLVPSGWGSVGSVDLWVMFPLPRPLYYNVDPFV